MVFSPATVAPSILIKEKMIRFGDFINTLVATDLKKFNQSFTLELTKSNARESMVKTIFSAPNVTDAQAKAFAIYMQVMQAFSTS